MQPAWKVLAPINLSAEPEEPIERAINIASSMQAELTLLYVVDQLWNRSRRRLGWPPNAWGRAQANCDIHRLILPGVPSETIIRYAEFINADMLVMTTRNYGRWTLFWKQSVTREVMKSTPRPVCVTDLRSVDKD